LNFITQFGAFYCLQRQNVAGWMQHAKILPKFTDLLSIFEDQPNVQ